MTKIIYFLLFVLTFTSSFSQQNYVLFLKNSVTKEPVQSATVIIKNTGFGTVSNDEGAFQISASNVAEIQISHLEFKTTTITLDKIDDKSNTIFLEPNTLELEDIIVTKEPINELLQKAVEISKSKFNKPIVLNTYYREFVKVNDKYTRFTDGLVDYHMIKSKADLIVNQSRAARLISEDDQTLDVASGLDVRSATTKQYTFTALDKILFNSKNYEDYDFELKSRIEKSGNEVYIVNFKPKEDLKKYLYKGTVVFNPENYLITDVEISSDQSKLEYTKIINILIVKAAILDLKVKSTYKVTNGGNYLLAFSSRKGKIKIWNKKKYNDVIEFKSDLVVTDFKKEEFAYNKKDVYNEKSLYERGNKYSDKFWQKNNSMVLTDEEAEIIKKLELETKSVN